MAQSFQDTLDEFLDSAVDPGGESFDTRISLVPPDVQTRGTVKGIRPSKFKNDDGEWQGIVEFQLSITDPQIKEETHLDDPRASYTVFLDTKKGWNGEGTFPLEMGPNKNIALGRMLTACKMNDGRKWRWSEFMHNDVWLRTGRPRSEEDRFAPVVAIGPTEDSVERASRRK